MKIVQQIPLDQPIIFAPDRNLGRYVMQQTGRDLVLWEGSCIVHETFSEKKIVQLKITHPEAEAIATQNVKLASYAMLVLLVLQQLYLNIVKRASHKNLSSRRSRVSFTKCKN